MKRGLILYHDNARAHTALDFLANEGIQLVTYSSDLNPCDFSLFSKLKLKLKGRIFIEALTAFQLMISTEKLEKLFRGLVQKDEIDSNGGFFERM